MNNNKLGTIILCIYVLVSIILLVVFATSGNMELAGMDIMLVFIIVGLVSIKYSHGLDLAHLFSVIGLIGFGISFTLYFFPSSYLSSLIKEYGLLLIPISFIVLPIYCFIIIPKSKYSNIMKTNPIETIGICKGYDEIKDGTRIRSRRSYAPIYEFYIKNKKHTVRRESFSSDAKKSVPIGTETKILINPNDIKHIYICKNDKEKRSNYKTVIIFNFFGILAFILFFINGF